MRHLAVPLIALLIHPTLIAQPAPGLSIAVLKGEAGINSIKGRTGTAIEVEVRDPQNKPVAGAQVIFQLPSFGASGSFPGGELTERTTTGPSGQAVMTGFVPNDTPGRFNIKVTADSGSLFGSVVVAQNNVAEVAADRPKSHKSLWILLAAGAAGGVAVGVLAGGKGGSTPAAAAPPSPTVTISTGSITVGGPR